jgi:uncharacterized protein (TIGR02001 family)
MSNTLPLRAFVAASMASALVPPAIAAESPWSFNFTAKSDYRFRGISQSDNDPALQGSVQYDHESGFFGNAWASTIDFAPFGDPDASIEIDLTAGYNHAFSDATDGTIKVVYYWYPDADPAPGLDTDYVEIIAALSHKLDDVTLSGEVAYSPDYSLGAGDAWALTGGVAVPIAPKWWVFDKGVEASGHLGHQSFDVGADYLFWDLGVSASIDRFTLDLRYVDTDIDGCSDICDAGLVFSASFGFGG